MGAMSRSSGRDRNWAFTAPDKSMLPMRRNALVMNGVIDSSDEAMAIFGGKPAACSSFLTRVCKMWGWVWVSLLLNLNTAFWSTTIYLQKHSSSHSSIIPFKSRQHSPICSCQHQVGELNQDINVVQFNIKTRLQIGIPTHMESSHSKSLSWSRQGDCEIRKQDSSFQ